MTTGSRRLPHHVVLGRNARADRAMVGLTQSRRGIRLLSRDHHTEEKDGATARFNPTTQPLSGTVGASTTDHTGHDDRRRAV